LCRIPSSEMLPDLASRKFDWMGHSSWVILLRFA
jgi:hypothetical protein